MLSSGAVNLLGSINLNVCTSCVTFEVGRVCGIGLRLERTCHLTLLVMRKQKDVMSYPTHW